MTKKPTTRELLEGVNVTPVEVPVDESLRRRFLNGDFVDPPMVHDYEPIANVVLLPGTVSWLDPNYVPVYEREPPEEIDLTPAMIDAGIEALLFVRNEHGSEAMFDRETIIRVFNAMMAAR